MSPVFDCTTPEGLADAVAKAAAGVREGRLVVLPTDTLYGVGADAFSHTAVADLLAAKGRERDKPPPVLVGDLRTVDGLAVDVPEWARELMRRFWPGALTIVLKAQPSLVWDLGDTGGTVALRMPDDEVALALLREVGPMAVSSANRTGHPASRTVVDAATQLGAVVEFYLDGGPVRGGLASTIVDATRDEPVILRRGAVPETDVRAVFDEVAEDHRPTVAKPPVVAAPTADIEGPQARSREPLELSVDETHPAPATAGPEGTDTEESNRHE